MWRDKVKYLYRFIILTLTLCHYIDNNFINKLFFLIIIYIVII